jgi:hypothetical protein
MCRSRTARGEDRRCERRTRVEAYAVLNRGSEWGRGQARLRDWGLSPLTSVSQCLDDGS